MRGFVFRTRQLFVKVRLRHVVRSRVLFYCCQATVFFRTNYKQDSKQANEADGISVYAYTRIFIREYAYIYL